MPQNLELEAVKRERASLFKSLAVLKTSQEKTGAKIQEDDIRVLRQELDAKMSKVNELREVTSLSTQPQPDREPQHSPAQNYSLSVSWQQLLAPWTPDTAQ